MKLGEDRSAAVHYLLNVEQHPSSHRIKSSFSRLANLPSTAQIPGLLPGQSDVELREDPMRMLAGWGVALAHGFSICLYGFGSKLHLVEALLDAHVYDQVVVFHAYQASASLGALLEALNEAVGAGLEPQCRAPLSYARRLCAFIEETRRDPLVLAIMQVDAPCLRSEAAIEVLTMLMRLPVLRIVCTCEGINASMLWGSEWLGMVLLQDCNTFQYYRPEELAALVDGSGQGGAVSGRATLQSCKAVLKVLPQSAQKAYKLLAEHQLSFELQNTQAADPSVEDDDNEELDLDEDEEDDRALEAKARKGLSFNDWYNRASQALIVSSHTAFRTQLTEFTDHSLVVGVENPSMAGMTYFIPFGRRDLQEIISLFP